MRKGSGAVRRDVSVSCLLFFFLFNVLKTLGKTQGRGKGANRMEGFGSKPKTCTYPLDLLHSSGCTHSSLFAIAKGRGGASLAASKTPGGLFRPGTFKGFGCNGAKELGQI